MIIPDELRAACAWVADRATHVHIRTERIAAYAASLPEPEALGPASPLSGEGRASQAAFWLTLDAINFGSGWFPTLRKRTQTTGYRTIAAGVRRRFVQDGPWSARELSQITAAELAAVLDQDPEHDLVSLFVASLRDLGTHLECDHGGSFHAVVDAAHDSAVTLVRTLAGWDCFADVSVYKDRALPFLKRAQIAAADLQRAGAAQFADMARLTMFADNLVPHVLRLDGILEFDPDLVTRIERGDLIAHGSPEEVEIRACAVQAVELIVAAMRTVNPSLTAAQTDQMLWNRGQGTAYKAIPRHRCRSTAY